MEILNTCRADLFVLTETRVAAPSIEARGGAVTRVAPRLALILVLMRGHAGHGVVVAPVTSRACAVEPAHPENHHNHYSPSIYIVQTHYLLLTIAIALHPRAPPPLVVAVVVDVSLRA